MARLFTLIAFVLSCFFVRSQDVIRVTDLIPQQKAIIVIPEITVQQLESLRTEFAKYNEITRAVYVYGNHNCLLVNVQENSTIKFYADLIKIIQSATALTEQQMAIKTSDAYEEILPSKTNVTSTVDTENVSNTNFIVK